VVVALPASGGQRGYVPTTPAGATGEALGLQSTGHVDRFERSPTGRSPNGIGVEGASGNITLADDPRTLVLDNATGNLYVSVSTGIQVVSTARDRVIDNLTLPQNESPVSFAYDPTRGEIFVSWFGQLSNASRPGQENLSVINTSTNSITANISVFPLVQGESCYNPATFEVGSLLYVNRTSQVWGTTPCGVIVISDLNDSLVGIISPNELSEIPVCLAYDAASNEVLGVDTYDLLTYSVATMSLLRDAPALGSAYEFLGSAGSNCLLYDPTADAAIAPWASVSDPTEAQLAVMPLSDPPDADNPQLGNYTSSDAPPTLALDDRAGVTLADNDGDGELLTIRDSTGGSPENWTVGGRAGDVVYDAADNFAYVAVSRCAASGACGPGWIVSFNLNPTVTLSPQRTTTDANATITFAADAQDLAGPPFLIHYSDTNRSNGCLASTGPVLTCDPSLEGKFAPSVNVTDARGFSAAATSPEVVVGPALSSPFVVSNSTPLLGETVAFVTNASGGLPPYNYAYAGFPPGCVSEDRSAIGCLPTQTGFYNVTVAVTDQNNVTVNATVALHVIFDFNIIVPATTPAGSPFTVLVDTNEPFSDGIVVAPAEGFGLLTYAYSGLPPGCTSVDAPSDSCTPTQVGTYTITVSVSDQVGDHQTHSVVVEVVPPAGPNGLAFLQAPWFHEVLGGVAAAGAVVAVVLIVRARRRRNARTPGPKEPASTTESSKTG
jgi:hypothetical protein